MRVALGIAPTWLTIVLLLLCLTTTLSHAQRLTKRDHDTYDYFALHLNSSAHRPDDVARWLGARHEGQIGELEDHHTFSVPKEKAAGVDAKLKNVKMRRKKRRSMGLEETSAHVSNAVLWSQKMNLKPPMVKRPPPPPSPEDYKISSLSRRKEIKELVNVKKDVASALSIKDPSFMGQWHLLNTRQPGHDLNVTGLWLEGITGNGSITAIIDDGLDMYSQDLRDNYYAKGSYDFNNQVDEPKPRLSDDRHGTRCAGEVAAVRNDVCGVGVAYDAKVAGIRILSAPISEADEAASINYGYQDNQVYSCSWGPVDDGTTMDAPSLLIKRAIVNGVQRGRQGKGSVFVFAAGNGAANEDNCNFDGYTNSIYSITVGAIDREDKHPYYSESCSAQLVVTYSSGSGDAIHTTDVGLDTCSNKHGGTSAAGPLMAGVVTLALSVNPDLSWRDIQYLAIETAIPFSMDTGDWQQTAVGKPFSHMYGYGKVDAYSLVKKAKDWTSVKPQAWFDSPWLSVHHEVPQGEVGLASYFEVTDTMLKRSNVERLEHVTVTMNVEHTRRGDLSVELRSPSGVVSHLSTPRSKDTEEAGYVDWTFMSVAHWGESGIGKWTIIVKDTKVNEHKGKFIDWQLTLWGEAIDAVHQRLRPLPSEHEHDHDQSEPAPHVTTTSVQPHPTGAVSSELPSDHPHRPTKPKPITSTASASTTGSSTATAGATISPSALPDSENNDKNVLPSFFPTFGVSKRTQIWIYIALGLIILFCSGLGAYFCIQRRKRLRNDVRDDYEFEMLNEDDEEGYPLAGGRSGAKKSKRTGGELYDAFAGESDEELLSEDDDDDDHDGHHDAQTSTYRDQPLEDQRPHNDHPEGDEGEGRETGQARD